MVLNDACVCVGVIHTLSLSFGAQISAILYRTLQINKEYKNIQDERCDKKT